MKKIAQDRDLFWTSDGEAEYRLITRGVETSWVIQIDEALSFFPIEVRTDWADAMIGNPVPARTQKTRTVTPKMRETALADHEKIRTVIENGKYRNLFYPKGRRTAFDTLVHINPKLTYKTFLRLIRLWFVGGCIAEGMLPSWDKCAHTEKIDATHLIDTSFGLARKATLDYCLSIRINNDTNAAAVSPEIPARTLFRVRAETLIVFKRYYDWKRAARGRTLEQGYNRMLGKDFSTPDPLGNLQIWDLRRIPSLLQFAHWYRQVFPPKRGGVPTQVTEKSI